MIGGGETMSPLSGSGSLRICSPGSRRGLLSVAPWGGVGFVESEEGKVVKIWLFGRFRGGGRVGGGGAFSSATGAGAGAGGAAVSLPQWGRAREWELWLGAGEEFIEVEVCWGAGGLMVRTVGANFDVGAVGVIHLGAAGAGVRVGCATGGGVGGAAATGGGGGVGFGSDGAISTGSGVSSKRSSTSKSSVIGEAEIRVQSRKQVVWVQRAEVHRRLRGVRR